MKWIKDNKKSFFFTIFGAILPFFFSFLKDLFVALYKSWDTWSFLDYFISNSATFTCNSILFFVIYSLLGLGLGYCIYLLIEVWSSWHKLKKIQKTYDEISTVSKLLDKDLKNKADENFKKACKVDDKLSKVYREVNNNNNNNNEIKKLLSKKSLLLYSGIFIIVIVFELFIISSNVIIPVAMNDSFNNSIEIIEPYTDHDTVLKLKSEWRLMKNSNDYNEIYSTINDLKVKNNLK